MYEVIVTRRVDFTEHPVERFETREEADACARRLALENYQHLARAWVRTVQPIKTKS